MSSTTRRMRGIAIHRPLIIGSTATPLTAAEKMSADPMHTHKWTVAVRSAASNPLPNHLLDGDSSAPTGPTISPTTSTGAAAGTRGRDTETDYHKHVGGKDDISHFIRRVQFKLHDSFPQPMRTCDRPPYQVSETGWGEFEVGVKIWWATESGEKPLQTFHYLKLHPWNPLPVTAPGTTGAEASEQSGPQDQSMDVSMSAAPAEGAEANGGDVSPKVEEGAAAGPSTPAAGAAAATPSATTDGQAAVSTPTAQTQAPAQPDIVLPPVVHSWQYDEVVFPEPTEAFHNTLIEHPPTPLPSSISQAFTDPSKVRSARLQAGFNTTSSESDGPPYPLHAPSSQPYLHGMSAPSIQAEGDRLDIARIEAVRELERERTRLIDVEKELRKVREKIDALTNSGAGATSAAAGGVRV